MSEFVPNFSNLDCYSFSFTSEVLDVVLDHQKSLCVLFSPPKLQSLTPLKKKRVPYRGKTLLLYFTAALDKHCLYPTVLYHYP